MRQNHLQKSYHVLMKNKINLKFIMNFPVTSKPICGDDGETRANPKLLFRNKLHLLWPIKPLSNTPIDINVSVVDTMRLVCMIPIKGTNIFNMVQKSVFIY